MKIILSKKKIIKILKGQKNLGFVPTMGALHKAHIYIIKKSVSLCNKTIVTIFINKPQFNKIPFRKNENLKLYPSVNKISRILGWKPKTNLKQGLVKAINYYKTNK